MKKNDVKTLQISKGSRKIFWLTIAFLNFGAIKKGSFSKNLKFFFEALLYKVDGKTSSMTVTSVLNFSVQKIQKRLTPDLKVRFLVHPTCIWALWTHNRCSNGLLQTRRMQLFRRVKIFKFLLRESHGQRAQKSDFVTLHSGKEESSRFSKIFRLAPLCRKSTLCRSGFRKELHGTNIPAWYHTEVLNPRRPILSPVKSQIMKPEIPNVRTSSFLPHSTV